MTKSTLFLRQLFALGLLCASVDGGALGQTSFPYLYEDPLLECAPGEIQFYDSCYKTLQVFGNSMASAASDSITPQSGIATYGGGGVRVHRRATGPDYVYVADIGNSRIFGFRSLAFCGMENDRECTSDADCPWQGDFCRIDSARLPDVVIGSTNGCCNNDCNLGVFREPDESTLCLFDYPRIVNTQERWQKLNFDVDAEGNLYVPDAFNNRILRYNDPLNPANDELADMLWGQDSFYENGINRSSVTGNEAACNDRSVNTSFERNITPPAGVGVRLAFAGVSVEHDSSNDPIWLWVADVYNHRVLRFPLVNEAAANLVLGQPVGVCVSAGGAPCASDDDCSVGTCDEIADPFGACTSANCGQNFEHEANLLCGPLDVRVASDNGDGTPELWVLNQDQYDGFLSRFMIYQPADPAEDIPGCSAQPCWKHHRTGVMFSGHNLYEVDCPGDPEGCVCALPDCESDPDPTACWEAECLNASARAPTGCKFQGTGFYFNPDFDPNAQDVDSQGFVWVSELNRRVTLSTRLMDEACNNDALAAINSMPGAEDHTFQPGNHQATYSQCGQALTDLGFNDGIIDGRLTGVPKDYFPIGESGAIGFDKDGNIYLSDQRFFRAFRVKALPTYEYEKLAPNGTSRIPCDPDLEQCCPPWVDGGSAAQLS